MRPELDRLTMGSTHKTIYQADAAGLHICVPPANGVRYEFAGPPKSQGASGLSRRLWGERRHFGVFRPSNRHWRMRRHTIRPFILHFPQETA
jgi:hypothetical protein